MYGREMRLQTKEERATRRVFVLSLGARGKVGDLWAKMLKEKPKGRGLEEW